jgi:hypothetical protein
VVRPRPTPFPADATPFPADATPFPADATPFPAGDAPARTGPPAARVGEQARERPFRLPAEDDPAPSVARMLGISGWAALLTLVGLAGAGRVLAAALFGSALPGWFEPVAFVNGLAGIGLTAGAFASVHRPRLPWWLLAGATAALALSLALTTAVVD